MSKSIVIENLKQIDRLEFKVPAPGVYVLSGVNGAGKSCLLTCLLRIGRRNAFQNAFLTSKISDALDPFKDAKITYTINNQSVSYTYGERWTPSPRSHSKLLENFGYPDVIYAAANADRIEPRAEDFRPSKARDASESLRMAAKQILSDEKFESLKVINVRKGIGAEAFLLPHTSSRANKKIYYSEKNFSLGEICVLKLLRQLETCRHQSLVLIDELELALHPKAQIDLLKHLQNISADKSLTVIFSTHSSNLIKTIERKNFYFIDRSPDGCTKVVRGCYPTYALGQLAFEEERTPDTVIYVEDEQAKFIVNSLKNEIFSSDFADKPTPTVTVAPIGTFTSIISYLNTSAALLPERVYQCALLDLDARDEYLNPLRQQNNHKELQKFDRVSDRILFLPWTPEVGICELLRSNLRNHEQKLRTYFHDQRISLSASKLAAVPTQSGPDQRKEAKKFIRETIEAISTLLDEDEKRVRQDISKYFSKEILSGSQKDQIKQLLMPILKR